MSESSKRIQINGPFSKGTTIPLSQTVYKIGISIGEKDFMRLGDNTTDPLQPAGENDHSTPGFRVILGSTPILIGRTFMYESIEPINDFSITFPLGAPASLIMDILYNG